MAVFPKGDYQETLALCVEEATGMNVNCYSYPMRHVHMYDRFPPV